MNDEKHPYIREYLEPLIRLHQFVFIMFRNDPEYDTLSLIDAYMRTSEIRRKMDVGNWSALNKGSKQVFNSFDRDPCVKGPSVFIDDIALEWIAYIYNLFQWTYNVPSKEISERIPSEMLFRMFSPLHETSETNACRKLLHRFFPELEGDFEKE